MRASEAEIFVELTPEKIIFVFDYIYSVSYFPQPNETESS